MLTTACAASAGEGTVVEHLDDGRFRVRFDSGDEHRYYPDSMAKMEKIGSFQKHGPQSRPLMKQDTWKKAKDVVTGEVAVQSMLQRVKARAFNVERSMSTRIRARMSMLSSDDDTVGYRGIKNVKLSHDFVDHMGGTEYGPMSTYRRRDQTTMVEPPAPEPPRRDSRSGRSDDIRIALQYTRPTAQGAKCESVLLLRFKARSFMDKGVSLEYLSCFPQAVSYTHLTLPTILLV